MVIKLVVLLTFLSINAYAEINANEHCKYEYEMNNNHKVERGIVCTSTPQDWHET